MRAPGLVFFQTYLRLIRGGAPPASARQEAATISEMASARRRLASIEQSATKKRKQNIPLGLP